MATSENQLPSVQLSEHTLSLIGKWTTRLLQKDILTSKTRGLSDHHPLTIDFSQVLVLDTNGACLILSFIEQLKAKGYTCKLANISEEHQSLLNLVEDYQEEQPKEAPKHLDLVSSLGKLAVNFQQQLQQFLSFLGEISLASWGWIRHPIRIRWIAIIHCIDTSGYQAMGIIALLSFLIGVVLCYQMGLQLEDYGAGIYVVDFTGIAILREFGPLLTAIIMAGRTGASFAAQIGTMKLNQEIDAITTMGLSPTELLILPKIAGLLIALPLLVVLSMIMGVFGGMVMAKILFGITYVDFLARFGKVIELKTLVLGMIKTPVFAVLIATIGCFQGLKVSHSAESVGRQTTVSVVQAIFMIIVTDAFFSIIYSKLGY